jgi:ankyrin repeat protein
MNKLFKGKTILENFLSWCFLNQEKINENEKQQEMLKRLEMLLAAGADVNMPSKDGTYPLSFALCYSLPYEFIQRLIQAGADIKQLSRGDYGKRNLLYFAIYHNEGEKVVPLLIERGADINDKNVDRIVFFQCAIYCSNNYEDSDYYDPTIAAQENRREQKTQDARV